MDVRGRDVVSGLPKEVLISDYDVSKAIHDSVSSLVQGIKDVVEETPPEIVSDVMHTGLYLTGGGAFLRGLAKYLETELKLKVNTVEDPMSLVAKGTGKILENIDYFKEVLKDLD